MPIAAPLHKIRSLHGFWRDLVPLYSASAVVWCAGGALVLTVLGTLLGIEHPWTLVFTVLFLGNFNSRPKRMSISVAEAEMVERSLIAEGYVQSTEDGRWRAANLRWWSRLLDSPVDLSKNGASAEVEVISNSSMLKSIRAFLARRAQAMSAIA
jgi:hypothetical protein